MKNHHIFNRNTFFAIVILFMGSSVFAWQSGNDLSVTGSGNTVFDHPPGLSNDLRDGTYTSFSGSYGWLKIDLDTESLIQAVELTAQIPDSITAGIGYNQDGMQKMFPSGYFSGKSGDFVIDISRASIVTDAVYLIFTGEDLSDVQVQELSLKTENPEEIFYKKTLNIIEASENTSYETAEYNAIDGYPGTFWSVQESRNWWDFPSHIREELEHRYNYNRHGHGRNKASIEMALETPGAADILRVYLCDEKEGDLTLSVMADGQWTDIDAFSLRHKSKGWLTYQLPDSLEEVESVKIEILSNRSSFGGVGEVEVWGKGGYSGKEYSDLIAPNFSYEMEQSGFFTLEELKETDTYTLTLPVSGPGADPAVSINGFEAYPDRILSQDSIDLFEYDLYPNQLWVGDNFILVETSEEQNCFSMHLTKKVTADDGYLDFSDPVLSDGRTVNSPFGSSEGILELDGQYDLLMVKVYYNGSAPTRVYQQLQQNPPNHPHYYSPYAANRFGDSFVSSGIGSIISSIFNWNHRNPRNPHHPPEPPEVPKDYLDLLEEGEGYVLYGGNGIADIIGFTGGMDVTEIQFLGSRTEETTPYVRILSPEAFGNYQKNELDSRSLYGITDSPDSDIRINGRRAIVHGNIFWLPISSVGGYDAGVHSLTAEVTDNRNRISSYEVEFYVQSERYGIELDQKDSVYYTRADSFQLTGNADSRKSRLFVNDKRVSLSGNSFTYDVPLQDGLNLIKVNFVDRWRNKTVGYYIKRVFKFSGDFSIDVKVPVDGQYVNSQEVFVSGYVRGAGLERVLINGEEGRAQGSGFSSSAAVALPEAANTILVEAFDKTGYKVSKSITVYRDTEPPVLSNIKPVDGSWFSNNDITFSGRVTDDNSCAVFVNGLMAMQSGETFLVSVPLEEEENTISLLATDLAGNVNRVPPFTINIDTTPPEPFEVIASPDSWTNQRPEVSFTAIDTGIGVSHYEVSVNGKSYVQQRSPYTVPFLDDGENTVYVKAVDMLGNSRVESVKVYIDTTPPEGPDNLRLVPGPDSIQLKWTDDNDQVRGYELTTPEGETVSISSDEGALWDEDDLEYAWTDAGLTAGDKRTYSIRSIDRAGNISEAIEAEATVAVAETAYVSGEPTVLEYDGIHLALSADAVPEGISSIIMEELSIPDVEELTPNPIIGSVYSFAVITTDGEVVENITFDDPFISTISYSEEELPEGVSEDQLEVYYFDTFWGSWFAVEDSYVDTESNTILFLTDHFTEFSVQATEAEDLTPEELTTIEYSNFTGTVSHDPLSVSPQDGSASTSMTDLTLPGKNGFDFAVRRLYSSSLAQFHGHIGIKDTINEAKDIKDLLKLNFRGFQPELNVGQGWQLDFPHLKYTKSGIFVAAPGGSYYDLTTLDTVFEEGLSYTESGKYVIYNDSQQLRTVFANHDGNDFTFIIIRDAYRYDSNTPVDGETDERRNIADNTYYKMSAAELYMKDGTSYHFDSTGKLLKILDSTQSLSITFTYDNNGLIDYVIDSIGRKIKFEYSFTKTSIGAGSGYSVYPHLSKVYVVGDDRSITYDYYNDLNQVTGNSALYQNYRLRIPFLKKAVEDDDRTWDYTYSDFFLGKEHQYSTSEGIELAEKYGEITANKIDDLFTGTSSLDRKLPKFYLKSLTGPGIGTEKLDYKIENVDYHKMIAGWNGQYYRKIKITGHLPVVSKHYHASESVDLSSGFSGYAHETYTYNFDTYKVKGIEHYDNEKTVIDDGRLQTVYYFNREKKKGVRYAFVTGFETNIGFGKVKIAKRDRSDYYIPINIRIDYKDSNSTLLEWKTFQYDDDQRITQEKYYKNYNRYTQTNYTYDAWSNYENIIYKEQNGEISLSRTITNSFLHNSYIHNLLGSTKVSESYNSEISLPIKETLYKYNKFGQKIEVKEKIGGNEWASTFYNYYWKTNGHSLELKSITTPTKHITSFSYTYPENSASYTDVGNYTVTQKEEDLKQSGTEDTYTVETVKSYDFYTGNLVSYQDGKDNLTTFQYDAFGRKTSEVRPHDSDEGGVNISIIYDDVNLTTTHTDAMGAVTKYYFDLKGQLEKIEKVNRTGENAVTTISYNKYGDIKSIIDPNRHQISYTYDALDRLKRETFKSPSGSSYDIVRSYTYNESDNSRRTIRENGAIHYEQYDMSGNVIYQVDYDDKGSFIRSSRYGYNGDGKILFATNANGFTTNYRYNARGLLQRKVYPPVSGYDGTDSFSDNKLRELYFYDASGNLASKKIFQSDKELSVTSYDYNGLGQVLSETYAYTEDGTSKTSTVSYSYDKNGNVLSVTDGNVISSYKSYTSRNQVASETDGEGFTTQYEYDLEDRLVKMSDPREAVYVGDFSIEYVYNDLDRLIEGKLPKRIGDTEKPVVSLEYDARGNLVKRTEPDQGTTNYAYTFRNWVNSETRTGTDGSYTTEYGYDEAGNRTSVTEPGGSEWKYTYDGLNRVIKEEQPDGAVIMTQYDGMDNVIAKTNGNGFWSYFGYDSNNRMVSFKDPRGAETTYEYDIKGNRTRMTDPNLKSWEYLYDELDRMIQETNSRKDTAYYYYDEGGRLKKLIDPSGTNVSYSYNDRNLPVTVNYKNDESGKSQVESFVYDEAGSVKSAALDGVIKRYNYLEDESGDSVYTPDPYGMIYAQDISFEGYDYRTEYSYDVMNRLTGIDYSQGLQINQAWNNLGQITGIDGYASDFLYDENGRMDGYFQGNGVAVDYDYDTKGRLSLMDYNSLGESIWSYEYGYDKDDNMTSRNEDLFGYDRNGQLVSTYLVGEDVETEYEIDKLALMHSEMDVLGEEKSSVISGNLSLDYGASSITIDFNYLYRMKRVILTPQNTENRVDPENLVIYTASFNEDGYYETQPGAKVYYDESGNLNVEFEEPVFARYLKLHCHYNEMDEQGEPVKAFAQFMVSGTDSVEAYAVVSGRNEFYIYDDKGNRKSRYLMTDTSYYDEYTLYGDSDLMQTDGVYGYMYDKNGNMIAKGSEWTSAGEGFHLFKPGEVSDLDALVSSEKGFEYYEYEYDLKNRLRAVYKYNHSLMGMEKTASYLYDIDGYRIKKQNKAGQETHFVFDTSGKILEEVSLETGNVISSVFLKSRHLARVTAEETLFYGTDHQGSTVIVTDQTGSMVWSGEATPFGDAVVRSSGDRSDLDLKYTGKDLDEDTGLYYYNARWYDAQTGRFISEDPARDGQNWYSYVTNNPLKYTDPTGMNPVLGAGIGFVTSSVQEVVLNKDSNQSWGSAIKETYTSGRSLAVIGTSTALGALTGGASALATKTAIGATKAGSMLITSAAKTSTEIIAKTTAINASAAFTGAAATDIITKDIKGQEQSFVDTINKAADAALFSAITTGMTQGIIASSSTKISGGFPDYATGEPLGSKVAMPSWSSGFGSSTENVLPAIQNVRDSLLDDNNSSTTSQTNGSNETENNQDPKEDGHGNVSGL